MQIKPRQHLLDIWQAIARHSFEDGEWAWGEWGGHSSVADAERLLCLMYPATEIPAFRLDDPDTTERDVQKVAEEGRRAAGDPGEARRGPRRVHATPTPAEDKRPTLRRRLLLQRRDRGRGTHRGAAGTGRRRLLLDVDHPLPRHARLPQGLRREDVANGHEEVHRGPQRGHQRPAHRRDGQPAALLHRQRLRPRLALRAAAAASSSARADCPSGPSSSSSSAASSRCAPRSPRASPSASTSRTASRTTASSSSAAGPGVW